MSNDIDKDAEMFRWLLKQASIEHRDGGNSGSWQITGIPAYENWIGNKFNHRTFRGAIRAAMEKEKPCPTKS